MLEHGKVVLVTGARHVVKTTVLKHRLGDAYGYITLEDPIALAQAKSDAGGHGGLRGDFGHVSCQPGEPYLIAAYVQAVPVWEIRF